MNIDAVRDKVNEMVNLIEEKKEINDTMYTTLCDIVNIAQGSEYGIILYDGFYDIHGDFKFKNSFTGEYESVIALRYCDGYLQCVMDTQFHRFPKYVDEIDEDMWTVLYKDNFDVEEAFDVLLQKIAL